MRLIIIRHGETKENKKDVVQGHTLGSLTKEGKKQVKRLAERLKNEKIDIIYSSDLPRAKETTRRIAHYHQAKVIFTKALRERNAGIFGGRGREKYYEAQKQSGLSFIKFRPKGGESYEDLKKRVEKFFKKIKEKHYGQTVLLSTHRGPLVILLGIILNIPLKAAIHLSLANTCVNIIELTRRGIHKIERINCYRHLV